MRPEQWEIFKKAARREKLDKVPMALIIDSPWIPGYLGLNHMDYYLDPELWFQSNLKIHREYPDIIFVPSWWMEYGMAAEPSVLGAKIKFWQDNTPSEYNTLYHLEDIDQFPEYEVESIFILDDIVGFINEEHYLEFAHPYLKRICDAFPDDWIKVYHNDAEVDACLDHLPDAGFHVLNWGKQKDIVEVKARVGDRMCLMGNVNPLEIGVRGTPEEVRDATLEVLEGSGGEGIILSVGGGTSPGMPRENIVAMQEALEEFNSSRLVSQRPPPAPP